MPVIAVVNRKGGSGKSTLAAHLAAWYAHKGCAVMLGDVDRQQSTRSWLRKRSESLPTIAPWTVDQNILRVPKGITHVVLDTPGGLHGFDLARMVMFADVILMPVCGSSFDRESAAGCHAELMTLPRIASGRCKVACIGMRIDMRSRAPQVLQEWAQGLGMPFLGVLRETPGYVQCLERGMTLFDLPPERFTNDLKQWAPILNWLDPLLSVAPAVPTSGPATTRATPSAPVASIPSRLAAAPVATTSRPGSVSPTAQHLPATQPRTNTASRPLEPRTVTRLNNPRVLDRVSASVPSRVAPEPARATPQPAQAESAPIPSFLKLVKC